MLRNKLSRALVGGALSVVFLFVSAFPAVTRVAAGPGFQLSFPNDPFQYFPSTRHYVRGPFLEYYNMRGGSRVFGYPQTESFYDSQFGLWVQYFDNVRMEWHPSNPEPYQVQLGLLAEELGYRRAPISPDRIPNGDPFRDYFPETGHVVSFAFLTAYNHYGLDICGYPIAEPALENGIIVQYFQRVRMEWHPERPQGERVTFGALGLTYLQRFNVPADALASQPRPSHPSVPVSTQLDQATLRVRAFVRRVITGREGTQTVYVYVTDADHQPQSGLNAIVAVHFPTGTAPYLAGPTDGDGIAEVTFPIMPSSPGERIVVDVTVEGQAAQTFFLIWY